MKKTILLITLLLSCFGQIILAQKVVTGKITNLKGIPLSDVNISVKNTDIKVITDSTGYYSVSIPQGYKTLVYQKIGFYFQEIDVNSNNINVKMASEESDLFELSLEDLMNIQVTSASKSEETLTEAPANIQIITEADIKKAGYRNIIDIFKYLPGFDVTQSYGSDAFQITMRGFRTYIGAYYMILIDGVNFDDLWYQDDKMLETFPISNIERIEIIYGPSSSIYGVSALMGVVNIITRKDVAKDGVGVNANLTTGFNSVFCADFNVIAKKNDFRFSITGRFDDFDVKDIVDNNQYEWTKDKYIEDSKLWGNVLKSPAFGGGFSSVTQNKAIDTRLFYKNTEFAFQYFLKDPGQGLYTALDQVRSQIRFARSSLSAYIRHKQELIPEKFISNTLVRYRENSVLSDAPFLYCSNVLENNKTERIATITLYQSLNSSWSVSQDFDWIPDKKIKFVGGFFYERKNLQRDYETASGPSVNVQNYDPEKEPYPFPIPNILQYDNRMFQTEYGAYTQGTFNLYKKMNAVLGIRYNNNSLFGSIVAFRGAIIATIDKFNFKLLYGEGNQAPAPRLLYAGWTFQGSNLNLKPIKSKTVELNLNYFLSNIVLNSSIYYTDCKNAIMQKTGGAENMGEKNVFGADISITTNFKSIAGIHNLSFWAKYGYTNAKGDEKPILDANNKIVGFENGELGDIASNKFYIGSTVYFTDKFLLNIQGRYVSELTTYYSNPIRQLDPFFVFDANIAWNNISNTGLGVNLKIENLFDVTAFTPGVGSADAGETPGYWENDIWNGSKGYYSSKYPLAKRLVFLTLSYKF